MEKCCVDQAAPWIKSLWRRRAFNVSFALWQRNLNLLGLQSLIITPRHIICIFFTFGHISKQIASEWCFSLQNCETRVLSRAQLKNRLVTYPKWRHGSTIKRTGMPVGRSLRFPGYRFFSVWFLIILETGPVGAWTGMHWTFTKVSDQITRSDHSMRYSRSTQNRWRCPGFTRKITCGIICKTTTTINIT